MFFKILNFLFIFLFINKYFNENKNLNKCHIINKKVSISELNVIIVAIIKKIISLFLHRRTSV